MNKKNLIAIILPILFLLSVIILIITTNNKTSSYDDPYIPIGFSKINNNYKEGIIIKDNLDNEFVWIPVNNINISRKEFKNGEITNIETNKEIDRIYYGEEVKFSKLYNYAKDNPEYNIDKFIESIKNNGGFYISRYEMSLENNKIYSKPHMNVLNNVTRDEAFNYSINMYDNNDIISSLINSYAWDITLEVLNDKEYLKNKENTNKNILKTGESNDIKFNIYDLSGNVSEWTSEYSSNGYYSFTSPCVQRGNNYSEEYLNPTIRQYNGIDAKDDFIGFRTILYIK